MRAEREAGRSYQEIETSGDGPLVLAMASDNLSALQDKGSQLRRAEARALHNEGMLAGLYGDTVPVTESSRAQGGDICVTAV